MINKNYLKLKKSIALIGASFVGALLVACGEPDLESVGPADTTPAITEVAPEVTPEEKPETVVEHTYIPNKEGDSYYSLLEELDLEVRSQRGGTCWTNSAATSIESTYFRQHEEKLVLNPEDMALTFYDPEKAEGWFAPGNYLDIGGWNWMVVEAMSNGYEGYVLDYARNLGGECARERMKEAIKQYGAVAVAVPDNSVRKGYVDGYMTMNDPGCDYYDHAVVVVGWDDNFPKENFHVKAKENGAWLCQNSKGKTWGNDGLYWVSYETLFEEATIFSVTDKYSEVLSYDFGNENRIETGEETAIANIFHKEGTLAAVGTFTGGDNQEYTIEVYDEKLEKLLSTVTASMDINGYQVVELPEPIEVKDYAVIIRFKGSAPVEGEPVKVEDGEEYRVTSEAGQSFVSIEGKWEDLALESTKEKLGIDFTPNNACIKALYK